MLQLITRSETKFWLSIVLLFVFGLGYLSLKLTKGYSAGYLKSEISGVLKLTLMLIQGFGSLLLALILPNNYLMEVDFFNQLYEKNDLWIALSILVLLILILILSGSIFTVFTRIVFKRQ